jgi:putative transposase
MNNARTHYPSDLTDLQWDNIEHLFDKPKRSNAGRRRKYERRHVLDALFYMARSGCSWRMLPHDFPPWSTIYSQIRRWKHDGVWPRLHDRLREEVRLAQGRQTEPSAAVMDSQTVKAGDHAGERGYDAGKKTNGRKRHILVDMLGLLMAVVVTTGKVQDRDGAKAVLRNARGLWPRLRVIFADGGYAGQLVDWVKRHCGWLLQTVLRPVGSVGFVILPKRWVVERTFGWFIKYRRLVKDYEADIVMSETMIYAAMTHRMLRLLD